MGIFQPVALFGISGNGVEWEIVSNKFFFLELYDIMRYQKKKGCIVLYGND